MAVFPVILVNSATGSDSLASGAGPATAKTGTLAATDGVNGKTVTITDTVDLSGVATDGSAAIYIADATAGHRNFDQITAVAGGPSGSPWTVTVANGFSLSLSGQSWAIGGQRASVWSGTSARLLNNNSSTSDCMPGWVVEMQSGHTETATVTNCDMRRSGDVVNGPIILRGASGAATVPVLTNNQNGAFIRMLNNYQQLRDFECRNSNATKTTSVAITVFANEQFVSGIKIDNNTSNFWKGISAANTIVGAPVLEKLQIGYCTGIGIELTHNGGRGCRLSEFYVHDCTSHGISISTTQGRMGIERGVLYKNGGSNIYVSTSVTGQESAGIQLTGCTLDAATADGVTLTASNEAAFQCLLIENCNITNNGGYGINASGSPTAALLSAAYAIVRNNVIYNNTSGTINPASLSAIATGTQTANPVYGGPASSGGNWMIGTADKATGYPTAAIPGTATFSYVDPGAAQRQEAGGGGSSILRTPDMSGGMVG